MQYSELLEAFLEFMRSGGFVMWPLFIANLFLWYGMGYRFHALRRGKKAAVRRLIEKHHEGTAKSKGLLDRAISDALHVSYKLSDRTYLRQNLDDVLFKYEVEIKQYSSLVKTIVIVAPLTGLLGTVIGMIETFDSLQAQALFTQGGGIAGGISQALFTTQFGLGVAIPGLIIGRILDRKERSLLFEFEQIKDVVCTMEKNHAIS
ncbi:MAG: MotA/TolQ/ExbB proton channel family protein [Campylobacterota bacterium]|nr:MotA/TolQ/ExbB proton channel family protein [Campylobacterota bacterium]